MTGVKKQIDHDTPLRGRRTANKRGTYNVTLRRVSVKTVAVKKQYVLHVLSVFVALVIQHAKRKRRIILPSVVWPDLPYISTLSHKRYDFRKKY